MDRTEITFSGRMKYDDTSLSNPFTFYDDNREKFGVTIDAGRDVRERVETDCIERSAMFSYNDLCIISGRGTVEIRGSQVFISVHQIDSLSK